MSMNTTSYEPTCEAVFTETMQIGTVVRDLDATIKKFVDDYGIGPWHRHEELTPENATDLHIHGQPGAPWRVAAASAMVGRVMWELIVPLDDECIFAQFLAEKGGGCITLPWPSRTSTRRWRRRPNGKTPWRSAARSAGSTSRISRLTVT
jgi:hypothetical protein